MPNVTEPEVEMRTEKMANRRAGMNTQAYILLQAMAECEVDIPSGCWISTAPFCNCREMGFVVSIRNTKGEYLNIAFYEHRNSDDIIAQKWEGVGPISGGFGPDDVKVNGKPWENKFDYAASFRYMEIQKAIDWTREQIEEWTSLKTETNS